MISLFKMQTFTLRKCIALYVFLVLTPLGVLTDQIGCKSIACPAPEPCPSDSYLKLITKHPSVSTNYRSTSEDILRRENIIPQAKRQREDFVYHLRKRSTPDDDMLIQYCCPRYECACKPNVCDHECTSNRFSINATHPTEYKNDVEYGVPGNCCSKCKRNYCMHQTFRKHGEKWHNDDCTTCECYFGEVKCQQSYCKPPDCLSYKKVPGECCPVCDNESYNFCKDIESCNIHCKYGYRKRDNCNLCQCNRSQWSEPTIETNDSETNNSRANNSKFDKCESYCYGAQFIIICILGSIICIIFIVVIMLWCHSKNSAKYTTVQTA
ncbi:kielin/chordin-like protein isoform X1 [Uranotaenia lowii]|uniref:kielin/chordin-like protein isoform X1 n=1 Tax=Uranotaenia lowii TaxID=190385 RepID=UPI00247A64EA|nr:kielin/chordin-like protein isoform X1 [Uranotaenia lowii]XP_055590172.1 kielin/chordin-like protein isoform X1 [Uranotaenia lowii]XP_055590173.1 kielin/chordin-like protein isoform X1 [Uranotaenia lowii]XP_055590174.1 kielin/chordin-like protein isoform X1 [Uranotaenia lowii]XP_055590175.1 kielin/chordin-like protein isoform X1 [Uranotaenia lowii]XP_055590176.1 kielin/chordin-like protein isoform X1 [Uranotaenia lowii]